MRFTTSSTSRLMATLSCIVLLSTLLLSVTAAPIDSSNANLLDARRPDPQAGGVAGADARIAARDVSSSTRPAQDDDAVLEERSKPTWSLKGLMKRTPEPKRFSLDDFTTIAAAAEKYDGVRPEGAGFVGLRQRGVPGWSRIY